MGGVAEVKGNMGQVPALGSAGPNPYLLLLAVGPDAHCLEGQGRGGGRR